VRPPGADRIENTVSLLSLPVFVFTGLLPGNALIRSVAIFIIVLSTQHYFRQVELLSRTTCFSMRVPSSDPVFSYNYSSFINTSVSLQPFVGPWPLFQFLNFYTVERGISPSPGRYLHIAQHKHRINAHRHPSLKRDSNPRSQCLSGRRQFMP
jgi:hypothetical protein